MGPTGPLDRRLIERRKIEREKLRGEGEQAGVVPRPNKVNIYCSGTLRSTSAVGFSDSKGWLALGAYMVGGDKERVGGVVELGSHLHHIRAVN